MSSSSRLSSKSKKKQTSIKIKKYKTQEEVNGVCDFIRDHEHHLLSISTDAEQKQHFSGKQFATIFLETVKSEYSDMNSDCQKQITTSLSNIQQSLLRFLQETQHKNKVNLVKKIRSEKAILATVVAKCLRNMSGISTSTPTHPQRVKDLMRILIEKLTMIIEEEMIMYQHPSLLKFYLTSEPYYLTPLKKSILFSVMSIFGKDILDVFEDIHVNKETRDYILSLMNIWKSNYKEHVRNVDTDLTAFCALVILKRVILACDLFLQNNEALFMPYMAKATPTKEQLEMLLKKAYESRQRRRRKFFEFFQKMRSRREERIKSSSSSSSKPEPTEQQLKQWEKHVSTFLQELEQEQRRTQKQKQQNLMRDIPIRTSPPQQKQQQKKQKQSIAHPPSTRQQRQQQRSSPLSQFPSYQSPGFHHRRPIAKQGEEEEDVLLRQRKQKNIHDVQTSLADQNLPRRIMETAIQKHSSAIILVDVANQRRQFPSQQQMTSKLPQLIPADVPLHRRRKPLFVLVEQTDLDQSKIPKVLLDDSNLDRGILRLKVSCVKETRDGRRIDCYKKEPGQEFTKNPMDDFVLLTLRHTLRSYYYRHTKKDTHLLKKLETFQELLSQNPYQLLLLQQNQELGGMVRQSYQKVRFDDDVPYTWLVSDDQWRDWTRPRR